MSRFFHNMFGWNESVQFTHGTSTPPGYCDFRPQLFYQEVMPWHIASSSLEFKMNMTTGVNEARFPNDANLESPGSEEALQSAMNNATRLIDSTDEDDEKKKMDNASSEVSKRLCNAVTWQDSQQVAYILRSCYVTQGAALPALIEASSQGVEECAKVLIGAGTSASALVSFTSCKKNALHVACENGHESCAMILIDSMKSYDAIFQRTVPSNKSFVEVLQEQDLNGMAKRLKRHVEMHLSLLVST